MARHRAARLALLAAAVVGPACGEARGAYNSTVALEFAYLATAAYCGYPKTSQASLEAWACGPACDQVPGVTDVKQIITNTGDDAFGFVGKLRGKCLVSFRGTSDLVGWLEDLESLDLVQLSSYGVPCSIGGSPCLVGDGFVSNYFSIAAAVQGNLSAIGCPPGEALYLTGHSLGAAETVIAAFDLQNRGYSLEKVYTFGQPRVGDSTFAAAFAELPISNFRVTYHRDPVVHLPPEFSGFQHIGREVFYNGDVAAGYLLCNGQGEDPDCADQYWDVPGMILDCVADGAQCDHLLYMTQVKQILMDGSSCIDGQHEVVV